MKVHKVSELERSQNPHGVESKHLVNDPPAVIIHLTLQPGEKLRRHETPTDVFFYVLEGTGVVLIGDVKKEVTADTLIESPNNLVHCWYNESDSILRILVIKTPKPTEKTNFLE
ncbi:MAG: cupin domain-containing protein [Candidatus Heimdallarchaeota archaeon]